MDEQTIIKESIAEIFTQNGYEDPTRMTQRDFDYIGEQLKRKSGTLISGTTVKRLAYGTFGRLPQIATLNAIANYYDYKTWQDYRAEKSKHDAGITSVTHPGKGERRGIGKKYLSIPLAFLLLAAFYFIKPSGGPVKNAEKATFSFRKNTANDIPNSVVFNYNVDDVQADSFFIQQSWDKNRRVRIYKNQYTLTDIYFEPGYHIAKLIANDSAIREVDVSIPTDRWFFYAIDNTAFYTPEYIKTDDYIANGSLGLDVAQLQEHHIDSKKDKRYHYVYFPSQMDVPAANFTFKTRVRMKEVRPVNCPYIELELYCQRSFMFMRSTTRGCAHEAHIQFGEQDMKGVDTDLLPISFDVRQWTDIEITVINKLATVKINDKKVFDTRFVTDTKQLAGLGFISNGLCEVERVELLGLDGTVGYRNHFDEPGRDL